MESEEENYIGIAGLVIQGVIKGIADILKRFLRRKVFFCYHTWKDLLISKLSEEKNQIFDLVYSLKSRLKILCNLIRRKIKMIILDVFMSIQNNYFQKIQDNYYVSLQNGIDHHLNQEIIEIKKNIQARQTSNQFLESKLKKLTNREELFKAKVQEVSNKRIELLNKRIKIEREKEDEIIETIQELKDENSGFHERIEMIENNISTFLSEMGGLLEISEESKKKCSRRTSLKRK